MKLKCLLLWGVAAAICGVSQVSASALEPVAVDLSGVVLPSGSLGMSENGRYILWSLARVPAHIYVPNLPDDGPHPIYLKDMETGTNKNIYVNSNGEHADLPTNLAIISGNGRYVVFKSRATNLDPIDDNTNFADLFKHDVITGETSIINIGYDGTVIDDPHLIPRSLSSDGRYLLFGSRSDQLVPNDNNGEVDLFMADLEQGTIKRITVTSTGVELPSGFGNSFAMSSNGRFIVFNTRDDMSDPNNPYRTFSFNLFIHDQVTGTTEFLNANDANNLFYGHCGNGRNTTISRDGRYATFACFSARLNGIVYNNYATIRLDRITGEYKVIERMENGVLTHEGISMRSISDDGRYTLALIRENVVNRLAARTGVHIMDLETGAIQEVFASEPVPGSGVRPYSISRDGRYATISRANNPFLGRATLYRFDRLYQSCDL